MEEIVSKYFKEELKLNDNVSMLMYKKISKYQDIFEMFCKWLETRNYEEFNELMIEGYTPLSIHTSFPSFKGIGVFNVFVDLRDNKEKTLDNIKRGFPRK